MQNGNGNQPVNGNVPVVRVELNMAMILDVGSYRHAGEIMDAIVVALTDVLRHERGQFDFTHINTHPCKAARMTQLATQYDNGDDVAYGPTFPPLS